MKQFYTIALTMYYNTFLSLLLTLHAFNIATNQNAITKNKNKPWKIKKEPNPGKSISTTARAEL